MNIDKLLRDLKVFCFVSLFYALILAVICGVKIYRGRKGQSGPFDLKAELRAIFANKNFSYLYSAIYMFTATYAVKNVVIRIIFMFIYVSFVFRLVKADLDSRAK